jgi:hypothetical protein
LQFELSTTIAELIAELRRSATDNSQEIRRTVEDGRRQLARLTQSASAPPDVATAPPANAT